MARIWSVIALCFALVSTPVLAQQTAAGTAMSAADAHGKALTGEIVFVDIRTPEEWNETGLPASAHAITMHQDPATFITALKKAAGGDPARKIAIICRSGTRTGAIYGDLQKAGFTNLINVAEGVGGGPNGRGWIKSGLPLRAVNQSRVTAPLSVKP